MGCTGPFLHNITAHPVAPDFVGKLPAHKTQHIIVIRRRLCPHLITITSIILIRWDLHLLLSSNALLHTNVQHPLCSIVLLKFRPTLEAVLRLSRAG